MCGAGTTDLRRGILPINIEAQMFFQVDKIFWKVQDVHSIVKNGAINQADHGADVDDNADYQTTDAITYI